LICPFDKFIFQIPKNQSIFDVGCGDGVFLYLLAIFRDPKKLFGVDIIDTDLDTVKKIFPNTNYKKIKDISDWPKDNFNFRVLIIRAKAGNDFDSTIP
jgi:SAM-dependent methyltransferase